MSSDKLLRMGWLMASPALQRPFAFLNRVDFELGQAIAATDIVDFLVTLLNNGGDLSVAPFQKALEMIDNPLGLRHLYLLHRIPLFSTTFHSKTQVTKRVLLPSIQYHSQKVNR